MKENLSKCPFCGGDDIVIEKVEHYIMPLEIYLKCRICGAQGPRTFRNDGNEEMAVEKWNTRDVKDQNAAKE